MTLRGAFLLLVAGTAWGLDLPPPLVTVHLLGPGTALGAPPVPLEDELRSLAWGPEGTLAVLETRHRPFDGPLVVLRVLDLVDDVTLEEHAWEAESAEAWWADHEADAVEVLARYRLEAVQQQLGVFPVVLDNEYYSLVLRSSRPWTSPGWTDGLELAVHSTGRGLKTVWTDGRPWRWAQVLGFLPSPFEDRDAVVLAVQPAGWAGAQEPLRWLIVGTSLKAGFPKP